MVAGNAMEWNSPSGIMEQFSYLTGMELNKHPVPLCGTGTFTSFVLKVFQMELGLFHSIVSKMKPVPWFQKNCLVPLHHWLPY